MDAAGRNYQLSGRDFTTERYGTLHSRRLPVPGRGELAAPGSLVAAGADTLASTRFTIALQPDYGYSASVQPGGPQPIGHCVGTVLAVPLRRPGGGESADTLWVTYGGLPDGATC